MDGSFLVTTADLGTIIKALDESEAFKATTDQMYSFFLKARSQNEFPHRNELHDVAAWDKLGAIRASVRQQRAETRPPASNSVSTAGAPVASIAGSESGDDSLDHGDAMDADIVSVEESAADSARHLDAVPMST
jgi:hypothetical protein